jgi:hypothetical protein
MVNDHPGLPTPRATLRDSSARVLVWCKSCRHQADADLRSLWQSSSFPIDGSDRPRVVKNSVANTTAGLSSPE